MAELSEAEKAYRRGFDQALAFVLYDNGAKNHQVQNLAYKKRVTAWRNGREKGDGPRENDPPRMTMKEAQEWRHILFVGYCQDLDSLC